MTTRTELAPADVPDVMVEAAAAATVDCHLFVTPAGWSCQCGARGEDPSPRGEGYRHLVAVEIAAALGACVTREEWRRVWPDKPWPPTSWHPDRLGNYVDGHFEHRWVFTTPPEAVEEG